MAADLALAADPQIVDRSADPAGFVVAACERAKAWLEEALEHGEIEQIAEIKSQAEAVRVYTAQKRLGRDAQLAAAEVVRRAERGIGLAIRRGQQDGQIARRGDRGSRGAPGVHGGNPVIPRRPSGPPARSSGAAKSADACAADGVSDSDFEAPWPGEPRTCPGPMSCTRSASGAATRLRRASTSRIRPTGRPRRRCAAAN
jgi:hypothetical protein